MKMSQKYIHVCTLIALCLFNSYTNCILWVNIYYSWKGYINMASPLKKEKEICIILVSLIFMVDISFIDILGHLKIFFFSLLWPTDQPKFFFIRNSNENFYWLELYFASFLALKSVSFLYLKKILCPLCTSTWINQYF